MRGVRVALISALGLGAALAMGGAAEAELVPGGVFQKPVVETVPPPPVAPQPQRTIRPVRRGSAVTQPARRLREPARAEPPANGPVRF